MHDDALGDRFEHALQADAARFRFVASSRRGAQREEVLDLAPEPAEQRPLRVVDRPDRGAGDEQRTDRGAVTGVHRDPCVRAHGGVAEDRGLRGQLGHDGRVVDHHHAGRPQRQRGERAQAIARPCAQAHLRRQPLPVALDEAEPGELRTAQVGGESDEVVERRFAIGTAHVEPAQRTTALAPRSVRCDGADRDRTQGVGSRGPAWRIRVVDHG